MKWNLSAYLQRLDIATAPSPDLTFLEEVHAAHIEQIPFENLDLTTQTAANFRTPAAMEKIVAARRGGVCYETGTLVRNLLEDLDHSFQEHLARPLDAPEAPATHLLFTVHLGHLRYLFDVGYGALGPRGVLPLRDGAQLTVGPHTTRLRQSKAGSADVWHVDAHEAHVGRWNPLYSFIDTPIHEGDRVAAEHYLLTAEGVPLRNHRVASRPTRHGRISLKDGWITEVESSEEKRWPLVSDPGADQLLRDQLRLPMTLKEIMK